MGYSYGYNRTETLTDYHTDRELLMMLIDIVSRGGNLLLDIGPTADGRIPPAPGLRAEDRGGAMKHYRSITVTALFAAPIGAARVSKRSRYVSGLLK